MGALELIVCGCDGSWAGPDGAGSCYLLRHDGFNAVLDMGGGGLGKLQKHISIADIGAVFVSHAHPDHWVDLLPLSIARHFGGLAPGLSLFVPEVFSELAAGIVATGSRDAWESSYAQRTLAPGKPVTAGPLHVTTFAVPHAEGSIGFRVEAGGDVFVYTGDTGPGDILVEMAAGADVLLAEATHIDGGELPFHLTSRQAAEYAAEAGVSKLVLTHVQPDIDRAVSLTQAKEAFEREAVLAEPGLTIAI